MFKKLNNPPRMFSKLNNQNRMFSKQTTSQNNYIHHIPSHSQSNENKYKNHLELSKRY